MKRYNIYFPENLMQKLKDLSKKTGAPVSELIRRAVQKLLEKGTKSD